mgnify:CR=1 FL=1
MNRKGFTLIELLGVIVILVTILLVAIPSVSSTLERKKNKDVEMKKEAVISAFEIYASMHKNDDNFKYVQYLNNECSINVFVLYNAELASYEEVMAVSSTLEHDYITKDGTLGNCSDNINNCLKKIDDCRFKCC